jgi:hypothetical protein
LSELHAQAKEEGAANTAHRIGRTGDIGLFIGDVVGTTEDLYAIFEVISGLKVGASEAFIVGVVDIVLSGAAVRESPLNE